jgi:ADP-ribosyl-[dinitrogen reductase] hydrolase
MKKRTSLLHPLQIAAVAAGPEFGRIGVTFCPGKYDPHGMNGYWDRDQTAHHDDITLPPGLFNAEILRTSESKMSQVEGDRRLTTGGRIPGD